MELPGWVEREIKTLIVRYLWDGKPPKISYNTIIGEVKKGGLMLADPVLKKKCFHVKLVRKYLDPSNVSLWKYFRTHFLGLCGGLGMGK